MSPVNVSTIGSYIREQREQAKISIRQLAQAAGVSNPYLSQVERGLRRPSADILQQIAKGLRISAEALYVQAGFLEDRPPGSVVREAVLTDEELTERQKQMLIEIYESFRKETLIAARGRDGQRRGRSDRAGPGRGRTGLAARPHSGRGHHRPGPTGPDGVRGRRGRGSEGRLVVDRGGRAGGGRRRLQRRGRPLVGCA